MSSIVTNYKFLEKREEEKKEELNFKAQKNLLHFLFSFKKVFYLLL